MDLAWHGESAEQQPALYAIIAAARLAHGAGMQSDPIMLAIPLFISALFGPVLEYMS